jgi:hypothetical protein
LRAPLTGISREDFAGAAGILAETIAVIEANGSARLHSQSESPAGVRSAQEVVAEFATYMLVDADRNFCVALMRRLRTSPNI